MINPFSIQALLSLPEENLLANNWTLTNRSLFRLFYFLFDGDLCSLNNLFNNHFTCKELYQEFISDTKYFSERISSINGLTFRIRQPYRRRMLEGATRAFLFHIKKHLNSNNNHKLKSAYQPCLHDGPCTLTNPDCYCIQNGTYCEKYCNCSIDCPHRFPGCACKGACLLNNCLCCAEGRECDPDLCHKCGASTFHNPIENFNTIIKT
jgi:histone-lysine N-methyltransferase EZH2